MAESARPSLPHRPFSGIFTLFLSLRPPFPAVVHPSRHIDNTLARPSCRRSCSLCPFPSLPKRSDRGRTKNGVLCRKILTFHTRHSKCEELFFLHENSDPLAPEWPRSKNLSLSFSSITVSFSTLTQRFQKLRERFLRKSERFSPQSPVFSCPPLPSTPHSA